VKVLLVWVTVLSVDGKKIRLKQKTKQEVSKHVIITNNPSKHKRYLLHVLNQESIHGRR